MKAAYSRNVDPAFPDKWADIIVRPENSEEVSSIVKIANKYKIPIVPRGGGADLVGGSISEGGILMDLTRMNRIIEINEKDFYCEIECGITWGELVSTLHERGLTTGMVGPGSGYAATIGGSLSNSSAGYGSSKYGLVTDNCLGVEVVLPNSQGTIIRTGSATNKYAEPFCRYGVAPDFTGLFMGDAGTMGIKTKAFLRLYPHYPLKLLRTYILNKNNQKLVVELLHKLQSEVRDGIYDMMIIPLIMVKLAFNTAKNPPLESPKLRGPVFSIIFEATDQRILDLYIEKADNIMKSNARLFEWQEIDSDRILSKDWKFNLKEMYNFFHPNISHRSGIISCVTCHKVPNSSIPKVYKWANLFDREFKEEFPTRSNSIIATVIYPLPNGHSVLVGGFTVKSVDEQRETAMKIWHKKARFQVRYGGIHYWLGETFSQSIVEAGAYSPEFSQFFKDMKKTIDPNFILSPRKFHMYNYEDDIAKYFKNDKSTEKILNE
ncbi:MAG: FAD-binding oxidoreductase [Candidatus Hodarchaeota archaeon]